MAPMTRSRANAAGVPGELMVEYYRQRASAGLIITEPAHVTPDGRQAPDTPGLHNAIQLAGWRALASAVTSEGGRVVLQLNHAGRLSHPSLQPQGAIPVAPSAVAAEGLVRGAAGEHPGMTPRPLETPEIAELVEAFARAAAGAKAAGFDGIDINGAGGYLIDQFLRDHTNRRTDRYGGSLGNRARFLLEVLEAVTPIFGAGRVGVRLSPVVSLRGSGLSVPDSDLAGTFGYVIDQLRPLGLAYLTLVDRGDFDVAALRERYGPVGHLANGGLDPAAADQAIAKGLVDAVAFGGLFVGNPDLVARLSAGAPLRRADPATFYMEGRPTPDAI
jgi:N-ethylmaleimide reductase